MLKYVFADSDLGDIRFGISPLGEMGLSLKTLRKPGRYASQLPWLRMTRDARAGLDVELLLALVSERRWIPDFLNPRPDSPLTNIADELDALSATAPEAFLADIEATHGRLPKVFAGSPRRALERTVAELRLYWRELFEPWWPRMRSVLEADIVHRGRQMASVGVAVILDELVAPVTVAGNAVRIALQDPRSRTVCLAGQGLTLVPTLFSTGVSLPTADDALPAIHYSCRGHGVLWETERPATVQAVADLLDATRTAPLVSLAEPASSTELGCGSTSRPQR